MIKAVIKSYPASSGHRGRPGLQGGSLPGNQGAEAQRAILDDGILDALAAPNNDDQSIIRGIINADTTLYKNDRLYALDNDYFNAHNTNELADTIQSRMAGLSTANYVNGLRNAIKDDFIAYRYLTDRPNADALMLNINAVSNADARDTLVVGLRAMADRGSILSENVGKYLDSMIPYQAPDISVDIPTVPSVSYEDGLLYITQRNFFDATASQEFDNGLATAVTAGHVSSDFADSYRQSFIQRAAVRDLSFIQNQSWYSSSSVQTLDFFEARMSEYQSGGAIAFESIPTIREAFLAKALVRDLNWMQTGPTWLNRSSVANGEEIMTRRLTEVANNRNIISESIPGILEAWRVSPQGIEANRLSIGAAEAVRVAAVSATAAEHDVQAFRNMHGSYRYDNVNVALLSQQLGLAEQSGTIAASSRPYIIADYVKEVTERDLDTVNHLNYISGAARIRYHTESGMAGRLNTMIANGGINPVSARGIMEEWARVNNGGNLGNSGAQSVRQLENTIYQTRTALINIGWVAPDRMAYSQNQPSRTPTARVSAPAYSRPPEPTGEPQPIIPVSIPPAFQARHDEVKAAADNRQLVAKIAQGVTTKTGAGIDNVGSDWDRGSRVINTATDGKTINAKVFIDTAYDDFTFTGTVAPDSPNSSARGQTITMNSQVTQVSSGSDQIQVRGVINHNGREVGSFTRTIYSSGEIHHDYFRINGEFEATGFGSAFYKQQEDAYVAAGIKKVSINANLSVGSYAWAAMGFDAASYSISSYLDEAKVKWQNHYHSPMPTFNPQHMWELAALKGPGGRENDKIGKYALLHKSWNATKLLTEGSEGLLAGQLYYASRGL